MMGLFSKDIQSMKDLFLHQLQDIYYAEKQITSALPKMMEKASEPELKRGFETHLRETETHVRRIEQVFSLLGRNPKQVDCPAMDGLIKETNEISSEIADKRVLDAALIASAQAVEHYEITRYGTLVTWARELGENDAADLLAQTLQEEKATDAKLTTLAEARVNAKAKSA
jgi:ferritin-like metal-binding protein YciE